MLLVGILAILASFQVLYAQEMTASRAQKCRNSVIRKEWRTLADSEKSEWLGAVKVRLCSTKLPVLLTWVTISL